MASFPFPQDSNELLQKLATNAQQEKKAPMKCCVFFVNATPYPGMINKLKEFHSEHGDNMKIMFACSYEGFMKNPVTTTTIVKKDGKETTLPIGVRGLPSNTRVFDGGLGFNLVGGTQIPDKKFSQDKDGKPVSFQEQVETSFKQAQLEVATELVEMFAFARVNKIPIYFGLPSRDERGINIKVDQMAEMGIDIPLLTSKGKRMNYDINLTRWLLNHIVIPSYGDVDNLKYLLSTMSKYGASYLADLYTVAAACLSDDKWDGYELVSEKTLTANYYTDGKTVLESDASVEAERKRTRELGEAVDNETRHFIEGVSYASIETKAGGNNIFSLKKGSQELFKETFISLINDNLTPNFTNVFLVHDILLNDIDDAPCKKWLTDIIEAKKTTNDKAGVITVCNYDRKKFQAIRKFSNMNLNQTDFDKLSECEQKDFNSIVPSLPPAKVKKITGQDIIKLQKFIYGKINNTTERCSPRIDPTVIITAYHKFFGITNGVVDEHTGYAVLRKPEERGNAFDEEQTDSCYDEDGTQQFMICRNAKGNGGTNWESVADGETGSKWVVTKGENGEEIKKYGGWGGKNGSMSEWHEFVIPLDTSAYWCNAIFFGSGPPGSKYNVVGTLKMLLRMEKIGKEWAKARKIDNPFFGFHEFPHNSLFHLHMHCIDLSQIYNDEGEVLPAYLEHRRKTIALGTYIDKLQQMLNSKTCAY